MFTPAYTTTLGTAYVGDSLEWLPSLEDASVSLAITSPPFALLRQKAYGNRIEDEYLNWLLGFARALRPKLRDDGSFVIDLGGAYQRGTPTRTLVQWKFLLRVVDELGFYLAQECYWCNPGKLPTPIEWVNKRKLRAKDAVNTVWWFSRTDSPKADIRHVLVPYSERMKTSLKDPRKFYKPKERPSGHEIAEAFGKANDGAIPSNLLQIPNTDSNSHYLRFCKELQREGHPARFPADLPRFFIQFLTDPGDVVVDIFSGSNTTGYVAEQLGRRWISVEIDRRYAALSAVRFMEGWDLKAVHRAMGAVESGTTLDFHPARDQASTAAGESAPALVPAYQEPLF